METHRCTMSDTLVHGVRRKGSEQVNTTGACQGIQQMVEGEVALGTSPEADCTAARCSGELN